MSVCLSVGSHISKTAYPNLMNFPVHANRKCFFLGKKAIAFFLVEKSPHNAACVKSRLIFIQNSTSWKSNNQICTTSYSEHKILAHLHLRACTVVQAIVKAKGKFRPLWASKPPKRISMKLKIYNYIKGMTTHFWFLNRHFYFILFTLYLGSRHARIRGQYVIWRFSTQESVFWRSHWKYSQDTSEDISKHRS